MARNFTAIKHHTTPHRTLVNVSSTNALANDQQSMHEMSPIFNNIKSRLPTAPTEKQDPIQIINSTFPNTI